MFLLQLNTRKPRPWLGKWGALPWPFLGTVITIACIGFATLYSAAQGHFSPWVDKQILRFILGMGVLLGVALTDIKIWLRHAYSLYAVSFIGVVGVELVGRVGGGAQSWINLYFFQIQPSEVMKITLILALARYFHLRTPKETKQIRQLWIPMALILAPVGLVMIQPDMGTATMILLTGALLVFLGGIPFWFVGATVVIAATALPIWWAFLHPYQKQRLFTFLDPTRDPLGSGYQIIQSKIALGSGGLWGKGYLKGSQSYLEYLPAKQTDFIFTLFCEEFGLWGGVVLLSLYGVIISMGYGIALRCSHTFGRLVALGVVSTLFLYVFINTAMVMGLLPVVGIPLPLMSYGGTSLLSMLMGFGFLLSVHVHPQTHIMHPHRFETRGTIKA